MGVHSIDHFTLGVPALSEEERFLPTLHEHLLSA